MSLIVRPIVSVHSPGSSCRPPGSSRTPTLVRCPFALDLSPLPDVRAPVRTLTVCGSVCSNRGRHRDARTAAIAAATWR